MSLRAKDILCLGIILLMPVVASAQSAAKVSGIEDPAKINSVETGTIQSLNGVTVENYCKSCKEILEKYPASPDGVYTIDPDSSGPMEPFECYCDMTTGGGGWTMVGHYRHPATENAPDDIDNRDYAYFMKAQTDQAYGRPEYIGNPDSEGAWTDWRVLNAVEWPVEFAVILDQPSWSTGWEAYTAKVIYRVNSRDIMPNYGTVPDLVTGANLYYKFGTSDAWTDVGSSSGSDYYYWQPRSSSNNVLLYFHVSNYAYRSGSPSDYHFGIYYGSGVPGGNNTWHHGGRLLIR